MPSGGLIAGGLGSAAIGAAQQSSANQSATNAAFNAVSQYLSVTVPDPAEQQLLLQQYQSTGKLDPRLATAFQQASSAMNNIQTDPGLKQAQQSALSSLENIGNQGGHTLAQDAYLNQNQQQVNAENAGRQGAIVQQFAARGMGQQGGLALSALEQNNQNMTQNENQASLGAAAQAQQNALQALQGAGTMAGQQQQQQFNQQASVAQAQNSINQFNTQMNQGVENANVNAQNQAQTYNTQNAQNIANQNTQLGNYQQQYNKQLLQNQYQNQLQKAQGAAAGYEGQAGLYSQQGQQAGNMWGNIGQGLIKTGGGLNQTSNSTNTGPTSQAATNDDNTYIQGLNDASN